MGERADIRDHNPTVSSLIDSVAEERAIKKDSDVKRALDELKNSLGFLAGVFLNDYQEIEILDIIDDFLEYLTLRNQSDIHSQITEARDDILKSMQRNDFPLIDYTSENKPPS